VASRLANRSGLAVLLVLFVLVILPTALPLFMGVRSGRWSHADISVRTERHRFYPVAERVIPIYYAVAMAMGALGSLLFGRLLDSVGNRIVLLVFFLSALFCPSFFSGTPSLR